MPLTKKLFLSGALACVMIACASNPVQQQFENYDPAAEELADASNIIVLVSAEQAANTLLVNAARRDYQLIEKVHLDLSLIHI